MKGIARVPDAYKNLEKLSQPGVFAIVNEKDRRVLISVSTDILKSVSRIFNELKFNKHDSEQMVSDRHLLDVVVLENNDNKILRLQKVDLYARSYTNQGYTFYKPPIYAKYEWYTEVKSDWKVELGIRSSFGTKYVDREFNNMLEVDNYLRKATKDKVLEQILKRDGRL